MGGATWPIHWAGPLNGFTRREVTGHQSRVRVTRRGPRDVTCSGQPRRAIWNDLSGASLKTDQAAIGPIAPTRCSDAGFRHLTPIWSGHRRRVSLSACGFAACPLAFATMQLAAFQPVSRGIILMILAILCFTAMDATAKGLIERYPAPQVVWVRFAGQLLIVLVVLTGARW